VAAVSPRQPNARPRPRLGDTAEEARVSGRTAATEPGHATRTFVRCARGPRAPTKMAAPPKMRGPVRRGRTPRVGGALTNGPSSTNSSAAAPKLGSKARRERQCKNDRRSEAAAPPAVRLRPYEMPAQAHRRRQHGRRTEWRAARVPRFRPAGTSTIDDADARRARRPLHRADQASPLVVVVPRPAAAPRDGRRHIATVAGLAHGGARWCVAGAPPAPPPDVVRVRARAARRRARALHSRLRRPARAAAARRECESGACMGPGAGGESQPPKKRGAKCGRPRAGGRHPGPVRRTRSSQRVFAIVPRPQGVGRAHARLRIAAASLGWRRLDLCVKRSLGGCTHARNPACTPLHARFRR
jgi:hypothetical protein